MHDHKPGSLKQYIYYYLVVFKTGGPALSVGRAMISLKSQKGVLPLLYWLLIASYNPW